jgi:hypothetical protein
MSFFVTSVPAGQGGDLGGLLGADARCQALATAAGSGKSGWRAFLSTTGPGGVHARDRIGPGPWFNAKGERIASDSSQLFNFGIPFPLMLDEKGAPVPRGEGSILTGSAHDGTASPDHTCSNWTSSLPSSPVAYGNALMPSSVVSWAGRAGAVPSSQANCSQGGLRSVGGVGRIYCFAP